MADLDTHNEKFEELCAGYVLNALEPEERARFEEMLQEADESQRELYHKMRSAANQLAFTVDESEPSDSVRQNLMEQIKSAGESRTSVTGITDTDDDGGESEEGIDWGMLGIAASFALLLVTLSLFFYTLNLNQQLNNKEAQLEQQEQRISSLHDEIERKEEMLAILEAREVDLVMMAGLDVNPDGYGKIIWDSESNRALLQVSNLPPVPTDKDYQLWIIKNNKPVSAGIFAVNDPRQDNFFKIEQIAAQEDAADAFAVTMEPKGGMPQPTGEMYLLGQAQN